MLALLASARIISLMRRRPRYYLIGTINLYTFQKFKFNNGLGKKAQAFSRVGITGVLSFMFPNWLSLLIDTNTNSKCLFSIFLLIPLGQ